MIEISIRNPNPSIPLNSIKSIIQAALAAADPMTLVSQNLEFQSSKLRVGEKEFEMLPSSRVIVVSLGKAGVAMAKGAEEKLGKRINKGICICKHRPEDIQVKRFSVLESSHPVPDDRSVLAALEIKKTITGLHKEDVVLLLLSGGGSALACLPAEGISLSEIQLITSLLLRSGASITEMNTVRKHLDVFKGGGFLRMAYPAQVGVLVLSDVIGNSLDVIASGPTVADPSTFYEAFTILKKYIPQSEIPSNVLNYIQLKSRDSGKVDPDENQLEKGLIAYHKIIGSNMFSIDAAIKIATKLGFNTEVVTYDLHGEARLVWKRLLDHSQPRPFVILAGGETTVTVKGSGLGGRNLELALGAVETISAEKNLALVTFATDGEDGPTDAAGAVVCSGTKPDLGFLAACLHNNDSYKYFQRSGGLILTGPTGTNVNDITFLIGY